MYMENYCNYVCSFHFPFIFHPVFEKRHCGKRTKSPPTTEALTTFLASVSAGVAEEVCSALQVPELEVRLIVEPWWWEDGGRKWLGVELLFLKTAGLPSLKLRTHLRKWMLGVDDCFLWACPTIKGCFLVVSGSFQLVALAQLMLWVGNSGQPDSPTSKWKFARMNQYTSVLVVATQRFLIFTMFTPKWSNLTNAHDFSGGWWKTTN